MIVGLVKSAALKLPTNRTALMQHVKMLNRRANR